MQAKDLANLSPEEKRALLAKLLAKKARRAPAPPAVTRHPLSYGQQALWFLHRIAPKSAAYNVAFAARIRSRSTSAWKALWPRLRPNP